MNRITTTYRVLVVDDRPEIRDMIASTLKTIGSGIDVKTVPSGEEALLEIQLQHFDLLVSDVLLAGINGIELMRKAKIRKPELRVILITGVTDPKLRQAAADAGADKFFPKPISTTDLLDAVAVFMEREGTEPFDAEDSNIQQTNDQFLDLMMNLKHDAHVMIVILTDIHGKVLAHTGDLQHALVDPYLFPLLNACLTTDSKIKQLIGSPQDGDFMYFGGVDIDVYAARVYKSNDLVMVVNPRADGYDFESMVNQFRHTIKDVQTILIQEEETPNLENRIEPESFHTDEDDFNSEASIVDDIFKNAEGNIPGDQEVDAFWDSIACERIGSNVKNPDILTFDQATRLGLTPGEDETNP